MIKNISLITLLALTQLTFAEILTPQDEINLFKEGTEVKISKEELEALRPWANTVKDQLKDLQDEMNSLNRSEKISRIRRTYEKLLSSNDRKSNELYVRYILNRTLYFDSVLEDNGADEVSTLNNRVKLLEASIALALKWYRDDIEYIQDKTRDTDFAVFALDYQNVISHLSDSVFNLKAQYMIERTSLAYLMVDLNRSINNKVYSADILKLNSELNKLPEVIESKLALERIKQIKQLRKNILKQYSISEDSSKVRNINFQVNQ